MNKFVLNPEVLKTAPTIHTVATTIHIHATTNRTDITINLTLPPTTHTNAPTTYFSATTTYFSATTSRTIAPTTSTPELTMPLRRNDNPIGSVFWQGRRWSKATTLPQSAAKMQPLRVGLSKRPLIGLLSTGYIAFCRLGENAYLCIRKGEERPWLYYSSIKSIPQ
ncbi:hypothetical protein JJE62_02740 [Alloprevotella tannerae]|uniref:hypothetical protein n=1 Tax=Alloprevotella tannerae TaxID=76122 RepID=UPI001EDBBDAC|nr:hypothetical protein [Alloprevotella tannerae]MCG2646381.1 hypothetical protein [Alloprevotella tannerae]